MAEYLTVPSTAVSRGGLVAIGTCPRHGWPMVRTKKRTFYSETPVWVYVLIIVSLFVAVIALLAVRKRVVGPVPECATCVADQKRFRRNVWIVWAANVVLFLGGLVDSTGTLIVCWLLLTVGGTIYSFCGSRYVQRGEVSKDTHWVRLKDVDTSFAIAATDRMTAAATPLA